MAEAPHKLIEEFRCATKRKRPILAKRLRNLGADFPGHAVRAILGDLLTRDAEWEAQYHLIMGLGDHPSSGSLAFLEARQTDHLVPMVQHAIGAAVSLCLGEGQGLDQYVCRLIAEARPGALDGALRAVAMQRWAVSRKTACSIFEFVAHPGREPMLSWASLAAAGWRQPETTAFLQFCIERATSPGPWAAGWPQQEVRENATLALRGEYAKRRPL